MSEGTYWIYRGIVRYTHHINRVGEVQVTWRMVIRRFIQRGDVWAAVVNGFPSDLDWSEGKAKPWDSLLIEFKGKFYLVGAERFAEAVHRLEQPSDDLAGLLRDDDVFLQWPLQQGDKFCDADGMARPDRMYCWSVESSRLTLLNRTTGVPPGKHTEFVIQYRTNPDHEKFTFVPAIGMTTYEYHHHGTVADTELKLVAFHQPSAEEK